MRPPAELRRLPWRLRYEHLAMRASDLRRLGILATHRHCHVEFRGPVRLGPGFALHIPDDGTFIVGHGVDFRRGFRCEISGSGRVEIGDGVTFTAESLVQCTTSIVIGPNANIGQATLIQDGSHRFRDHTKLLNEQGYDYRPVRIGRGANIAAKCSVWADVGEQAFIGANSVVTRDVPAFCLAVGAPARVIEYYGPPERRPPDLDI